jgi:hypothetical protein
MAVCRAPSDTPKAQRWLQQGKERGAQLLFRCFRTVAQSGQVLDFLHRSGNVHDSKGSVEFDVQQHFIILFVNWRISLSRVPLLSVIVLVLALDLCTLQPKALCSLRTRRSIEAAGCVSLLQGRRGRGRVRGRGRLKRGNQKAHLIYNAHQSLQQGS